MILLPHTFFEYGRRIFIASNSVPFPPESRPFIPAYCNPRVVEADSNSPITLYIDSRMSYIFTQYPALRYTTARGHLAVQAVVPTIT